MIGKLVVILTVAIASVLAASYQPYQYQPYQTYAVNGSNKSHNLIAGSRVPYDQLVYQENIIKSSSLWQIVTVQKTFNISKSLRITQVQALDQKVDGTGAYATLVNGGPGLTNVTIKFKSQRNHGIHFQVKIFAR